MSNIISELKLLHMRLGMLRGQVSKILDEYQNGNEPSPAKPRPRRRFNDDMLQLLHERGVLREKPRARISGNEQRNLAASLAFLKQLGLINETQAYETATPFSLDELLEELLEEQRSENSSPASDASGPRSRRRATPARKVTSSNAGKPAKRGKGGK